ncbi:hypothetical protein ACWCYY_35430 [Kitasatospora sp. NPDC001664]
MDLPNELADWVDSDGAAYLLGRTLGIFAEDQDFSSMKWAFWTANPVGDALHESLLQLTAAGILERDEDEDRFRWASDTAQVLEAARWGRPRLT